LEANGIEFKLKARDKPRGHGSGVRMILPEQIRELYESMPWEFRLRNQALIMFLKDSGLRVSDVARLNVGDWMAAETYVNEKGEKFKVFRPLRTLKTGSMAYPVVGPETVEAVERYLEERRRSGERLTASSPLFVDRFGKRLNERAMSTLLYRLCKRMGPEWWRISAHSFRKFHTTMLEAVMPKSYVAKLQGKKAMDSLAPYERPEEIPGELPKAYMKAYDRLRVFKSADAERMEAMERDIERLQRIVADLQLKLSIKDEIVSTRTERFKKWLEQRSDETPPEN